MNISFEGKRAIVTGAGKGIGRGISMKLAEYGAEVVAISRTQSDLDELSKLNSDIKTICLDIGRWKQTKDVIQTIGDVDFLVNNAAIINKLTIEEITEEALDETFDINVKAIVNISQEVAKGMKIRGKGGSIVNISSVFAYTASEKYGMYCASKGAVDQLTRTMAVEFGPHGIRVNSVNPTTIVTKMAEMEGMLDMNNEYSKQWIARTPLKRYGEVKEVVDPVLFLLSDRASLITGIAMPIDGGLTISF